jgi:hypothetical protein
LDVTNELVEYKCEFGHCSVPVRYKSNPQLGRQVQKQNLSYDQIAIERIGI